MKQTTRRIPGYIKNNKMETLKLNIVKAIKSNNHTTRSIVPVCNAELMYNEFCKALAELQIEGKIVYQDGGYYIA